MLSRRQFLATALPAAALAAQANTVALGLERPPSHLKLSLAAYSFAKSLDLKAKGRMTLGDFIDFAAKQPVDAVELTTYFFEESTPAALAALKLRAAKQGLDISGVATGNDFCLIDDEKRKAQLESVKTWIENTARLGGKTLRVFAGKVEKGDEEPKALARCTESFQQACKHAEKYGILLALENHGGVTSTAEQLLKIVKGVDHPLFGVNLDTGNFHSADPYAEMEAVASYASVVQLKTEVQPEKKPKVDADLAKIIGILKKANYRGYIALEYEASEPAMEAVPKHLATLRKLIDSSR